MVIITTDLKILFPCLITAVIFLIIGFFIRKYTSEKKIGTAETYVKELIEKSQKDAEAQKKEKIIEAKEEIHKMRNEYDKEYKDRRNELQKFEKRLVQKEETLDKKILQVEEKDKKLADVKTQLIEKEKEVDEIKEQQIRKLEDISNLTLDEAKKYVLEISEKEVRYELSAKIKELEMQAKEEADNKAREIVAYAIQRVAAEQVSETTVSVVNLPNDEMKGRIIGREGRNIRAIENLTGVDLIVDDTPEAVVLSSFSPIRREIARLALEKLIADGRIHPARIEEMVEKAKKEVDKAIKEYGEKALMDTGIYGVHPEIVKLMGMLHYRTSYGQNVLNHSIEISHLCGVIASELGADVKIAKRAGLFHDIGKAVDHEMEGTHVEIGMDLLKRYKESSEVIHAMSTHHGDYEPQTVEAVIVTAADAISAARPGARRETLETYIKRLEKLEEIANSFTEVEKSFAIQAGREVRIMVKPEKISDALLPKLARDVSKMIEKEMEYPGQIKVSIIRETRTVDYAK
ncbi:2',3'-cyclic-nucleotide 2'-phosphodiesterase [Peptoanaerobacter stomatis]|uniref:Ribonuclease Y n=2 Tax=Peptoanaerobacter stomatis TaxID=796937 RepID=G9X265_9FIRM|nr:ribonuclease Y [Peptoanaerobacter stomatis]EHL13188.1 2',3'-cyclic-nucleotide 2'-phosphodiesterase [Peptoanaerobacter stomatis]